MAEKDKKNEQLSLDDYMKVKEKRARDKLKLQYPVLVKIAVTIPLLYIIFMLLYFLLHLRHLPEH